MQLEQVNGTSKKTGKKYTAYRVRIGEYTTPLFFPSKVELIYIKEQIAQRAHEDFKGDDFDVDAD